MVTNAEILLGGLACYDYEVERVLRGRSHDGKLPLGFDLPFSDRADVRLMAARLASLLLFHLMLRTGLPPGHFNGPFFRTTLIAKLLFHLTVTGADTPEKVAKLMPLMSRLADAICEAPHLLDADTSINDILRAHCRRAGRKLRQITALANPPIAFRGTIWTDTASGFALEEMTGPRHLLIDNAVLRHSIGRYYDEEGMAKVGITENHAASCFLLVTWRDFRKGYCRIFTLTHRGIPRAALRYSVHEKIIAEVLSDLMPFTYDHELFWPLSNAMTKLSKVVDIERIANPLWDPGHLHDVQHALRLQRRLP